MNNIERRDASMVYISDDAVMNEQKVCRRRINRLNHLNPDDFDEIREAVKELLGTSEGAFINPPFFCDYGSHIHVGKNFYANYNCTVLDVAKVCIGDNCLFGPNVGVYTAGHPIHPATRNTAYEYGIPVTIGDNVWVGAGSIILPGVTIGSNSVIGAGSVVTKDIPDWVVAAGNPCKVIRKITDEDRRTYFRGQPIDDEAWKEICRVNSWEK